jgi:uncharacterized protein YraI
MMVVVEPKVQSIRFPSGALIQTTQSANLRLGPGTNYAVLAALPAGAAGKINAHPLNGVEAKGSYWWKVDFGGETVGWVAEDLLAAR